MKLQKQYRIIASLLLWLVILVLHIPVYVYAESSEYSDGYEKSILLSTTVPPSITSGKGAEYHKGNIEGLTFTTDDAVKAFQRVLIDETELPPDSYTIAGEPLTVTLHTDYLDTLSAGEHRIKIVTANGDASADFTVTDGENQESTTNGGELPNTGVSGKNPLWFVLLIMCSGLLAIAFSTRPERRKDNKK